MTAFLVGLGIGLGAGVFTLACLVRAERPSPLPPKARTRPGTPSGGRS